MTNEKKRLFGGIGLFGLSICFFAMFPVGIIPGIMTLVAAYRVASG